MATPSLFRSSPSDELFDSLYGDQAAGVDPQTAERMARGGLSPSRARLGLAMEQAAAQRRAEEAATYGQTRRAWNQGMAQLSATPDAVRGLYRNLTGPEGSGDRYLLRANQITEEAAEYAPDVQDLSDINGVGDAFAYARNALVSNAPTLLPTIASAVATGGTAGVVLGGARVAGQQALKQGVKRTTRQAIANALTPGRAAAVGAYVPSAGLQANQMVGAALDREGGGTARERAAKATLGALGTAGIETLPTVRLLGRFGLGDQATKAVTGTLAARMAKQGAAQAGTESTTELVQTFGEKLTHKWVNDNIDVLSPEALAEYANAFVAGGITGGVLGAPAGIRGPSDPAAKAAREAAKMEARFQGRAPAADLQDGRRPTRPGEAAPADEFISADATAARTVDRAPSDTVPPAAPPAGVPAGETPEASGPAAQRGVPADEVIDAPGSRAGSIFTRIFSDLDASDPAAPDFRPNWTNFGEWLRTQGLNTPALDRNMGNVIGPNGELIFDSVKLGIDAGGVTRGPISSEPLFNVQAARGRLEASKEGGRLGMTPSQALAASAVPDEAMASLSKDDIKAGALFLTTGDFDSSDPAALNRYLNALDRTKRNQFFFTAAMWSDAIKELREAGFTDPMTIDQFAELGARAPRAEANVDVNEPGANLEESTAPDFNPRTGAERIADVIPNAKIRSVMRPISEARGLDTPEQMAAEGMVRATNSKGAEQMVKLAPLVMEVINNPDIGPSLGRGDDRIVNAVVTAIGVMQRKGLTVDPASLVEGLRLWDRKTGDRSQVALTAQQARRITRGWESNRVQTRLPTKAPVQARLDTLVAQAENLGAGRTGVATGPTSFAPDRDEGPSGSIDRSPSPALRPGARPPELQVGPEGQLSEAGAIDDTDADQTAREAQQAEYERVFYRAANMLSTLATGKPLAKKTGDASVRDDIQAVQKLLKQRKALRNTPLGRAVEAAIRNLEEYVSTEPKPKEKRTTNRPTKLAAAVATSVGRNIPTRTTVERAEPSLQDLGRQNKATDEGVSRGVAPIETARAAGDVLLRKQDDPSRMPSPALEERLGGRNDLDIVKREVSKAAKKGSKPRMQLLANALTRLLGVSEVKVVDTEDAGVFGTYNPKTKTISIALRKRQGGAQLDTLLHELGHHIVTETWDKLPAELKKRVLKDYVTWRRQARQMATYGAVRSSRAPAFIKKWLNTREGQNQNVPYSKLTAEQRKDMLSVHEFMADQLARAMSSNEKTRSKIADFFIQLAEQLKALYSAVAGKDYKPAKSARAWVKWMIATEQARVINSAQDLNEQHELAAAAPATGVTPPPTTPTQGGNSPNGGRPSSLFYALNQDDRAAMLRVLRTKSVYDQIYLQSDAKTQQRLDSYGYDMQVLVDRAAALFAQGKLKIGTDLRSPLRRLLDLFKMAIGLPTDREAADMILTDFAKGNITGRNGRKYDSLSKALREGFTRNEQLVQPGNLARFTANFNRAVARNLGPIYEKLVVDAGERLRETNVPALAMLSAMIEPRTGEKTKDAGYLQGVDKRWSGMASAYFKAVEGLSTKQKDEVNRALQAGERPADADMAKVYDAMRGLMDTWYREAKAAGIELPFRKDFWPVMIDSAAVANDREGFRALLEDPKFEQDIRKIFGEETTDRKTGKKTVAPDTKTKLDNLIDRLVLIAETADTSHIGEVDFTEGTVAPSFASQRTRLLGFMQNLASSEQKAKFATYQRASLDAVVVRYSRSLAKRAEFSSRFIKERQDPVTKNPVKYNRLEELIAKAKQEGATPEQLQQARDLVNMAVGSYKAELNPAIKWVFSKWDALTGSRLAEMPIEKWGAVQMALMTYQNIRLLPLAAFSSFIDPLGVLVRSGGDFGAAFASLRDGMKAMRKSNKTDLLAMAETMGIVEANVLSDALAAAYGGSFDPSGLSGKINNALFKYNGLEAITRYSRLAALAAGHRFLLKHTLTPDENSVRFLQELGLEASDVKPDPNKPQFVRLNKKVETALYRFVEESVIRPKPTQRPNWHNDPNFMFASQYKGYLYSFWNTVPRRLLTELDNGNTSAALLPLLPYIGVTIVGEMLRDMVQGDEELKEDWGPFDYLAHATVRSGVAGPRFGVFNDARSDNLHGSSIFNSWAGPTLQQTGQITSALMGDRSLLNTTVEAVPGSVIFENRAREIFGN